MLYDGPEEVSDVELVSLVLGTGTKNVTVEAIAEDVLNAVGGLAPLARASPQDLMDIEGVGPAQAARLLAAVHLGRRALERAPPRPPPLASPEEVWQLVRPHITGLKQEVFIVIALDTRGAILLEEEVHRGSLTKVDVHPRDVFRALIAVSAACGIVVHNHPSGEVLPSKEDIDLTYRLKNCGHIVGIPIVDHVIVADDAYRSINEYLGVDAEEPPELPE
jgi:DNA repair protein RadC